MFIMGDSIAKHVRGYELSRKVENCKVCVKTFSGAKVIRMEDYVKPTLRKMPTHIIIHVGTNDVPTKKVPAQRARILLALSLNSEGTVMSKYQTSQQGMINTRRKQQTKMSRIKIAVLRPL